MGSLKDCGTESVRHNPNGCYAHFATKPNFKLMNIRWNAQSGFTLIELLVVVTITGVLAGLSFPAYSGMIRRARYAEAKQQMGVMAREIELYHVEHGQYPRDTFPKIEPEGIDSWPDREEIPYESFYDYDHWALGGKQCYVRIRYAGESNKLARLRGKEQLGFTETDDNIELGVALYGCNHSKGYLK